MSYSNLNKLLINFEKVIININIIFIFLKKRINSLA